MKLAFISSSFPPHISGVAKNAADICNGLSARGHQVGAFVPGYGKSELITPQVQIFPITSLDNPLKPAHKVLSPKASSFIHKLSEFNPDIVHFQEPHFFLFSSIKAYADEKNIPILFAHHFPPEFVTNQMPSWLPRKIINKSVVNLVVSLYNKSSHVVTPTRIMKELLVDHGLTTPISVISNGINPVLFQGVGGGKKKKKRVILYLGRLDYDKNLDILILATQYLPDTAEVWIAGRGAAEQSLRDLARSINVSKKIKFLGYVPETEKPEIYKSATVFAIPSTAEAQSIVSLEASACGLPLVVANAAALPELIRPNKPSGLLFRPGNPNDLARKINMLLSDEVLLSQMKNNASNLVDLHHIDNVIQSYCDLYLSLKTAQPR